MPAKVESTPALPGLSPVCGKPIIARFDGSKLSSDGGVVALREIESRLGIANRLAACVADANLPALQALLFHATMWHVDLSDFGRGQHGRWPQGDAGVVLWSLSVAANDWQSPERLTRMCTIPINSVLAAEWDSSSMMMEARILRTLHWFGLLDYKQKEIEGGPFTERRFYRKTKLFDRFLSFDVKTEPSAAVRY